MGDCPNCLKKETQKLINKKLARIRKRYPGFEIEPVFTGSGVELLINQKSSSGRGPNRPPDVTFYQNSEGEIWVTPSGRPLSSTRAMIVSISLASAGRLAETIDRELGRYLIRAYGD